MAHSNSQCKLIFCVFVCYLLVAFLGLDQKDLIILVIKIEHVIYDLSQFHIVASRGQYRSTVAKR